VSRRVRSLADPTVDENSLIHKGVDDSLASLMENCLAWRRLLTHPAVVSYRFWFGLATCVRPFVGGFEAWDSVSKLDPKRYPGIAEMKKLWASIKGRPWRCETLMDGSWVCPNLGTSGCALAKRGYRCGSPATLPGSIEGRKIKHAS